MNKQTKFKQTEIGMIPEDWEVKKIEEIGKVITGKTPPTNIKEYFGKDYPFVKIPDLGRSVYVETSEGMLSEKGAEYINSLRLPRDSVMFSCLATIGKVGVTKRDSFTNQQINSVISDRKKAAPLWIYYYLKDNVQYLENLGGGGSVYTNISKSKFGNALIALPTLKEQETIVKILYSLDSKIDLLQQMNKTLEEIGQAIFKHWFVDFEFPNEEGKPYKSSGGEMVYNEELEEEVPKGWKVEKLGNLIIRNKEKITNKREWKEEKIIDLSTMPQFSICLDSFQKGEKFDSNVFKLREMDILFGSIRPYFGKAGFSPINGVVTGTIFSYLPRDNNYYAYILFLTTSKDFIDFTVAFSKGTKMPIIGWDDFCSYNLVIPEDGELIERFNDILMPLIIKIKVNIQQIQTLSQARDSLLPKLMSGKIRVPLEEKE
jgi:type I restriction enzyme S subunit